MAQNPSPSQLDPGQIIKRSFDEANDRIRVDASVSVSAASQEVVIDHSDDSIKLGDGTNLVTATVIGSDVGLDVNLIGGVVSGNFTASGLSTGLRTSVITVTDSPTKIPETALTGRNTLSVRVWGTNTIYVGGSTVSTTIGYPKRQYEEISMDIKGDASVELYAICASGLTCEIRVLEIA
jgi:hypothetical protein